MWFADRPVAAGHHIHTTMGALAMAMNPDKLLGLAAGRTARHDMRRRLGGIILMRFVFDCCHRGPGLSFRRRRAAGVPS